MVFFDLLKFSVLVLLLGVNAQFQYQADQCCESYCYASDEEKTQTRQFATKTAYVLIKGPDHAQQYFVPHCQPKKVWIVSRHGTRLPSASAIRELRDLETVKNEIINNYEKRRTKPDRGPLCQEDYQKIKAWTFDQNITESHEEYLTQEGWENVKFLARNYQASFPEILVNTYNSTRFLFRHTNTERTTSSYKAFVEGLFGYNAWQQINLPANPQNDTLLRPYDFCPLWKKQKEDRNNDNSEISKFERSDVMKKTISDISHRLGFKYSLEKEQIQLMWDMCRYEQAWVVDRDSAWCAAFTHDQVDVLEYLEDLRHYYMSGYATELNTKISCELVQNMLQHLESGEEPSAITYFTHSSAIQLFLVALGIGRDIQGLRADNFNDMTERKWRTSRLAPFTSNFIAIKYECDQQIGGGTKVMFFLNQRAVELDWCKVGLCEWNDVKDRYSKFTNADCNSMYCSLNGASHIHLSLSILVAYFAYLLMYI